MQFRSCILNKQQRSAKHTHPATWTAKQSLVVFRLRWKHISVTIWTYCFIYSETQIKHARQREIFRRIFQQSQCFSRRALHESIWESGDIPPLANLGTRDRWVFRFTFRPIDPRGKSPRYPLNRRPGEHHTLWKRESSLTNEYLIYCFIHKIDRSDNVHVISINREELHVN